MDLVEKASKKSRLTLGSRQSEMENIQENRACKIVSKSYNFYPFSGGRKEPFKHLLHMLKYSNIIFTEYCGVFGVTQLC